MRIRERRERDREIERERERERESLRGRPLVGWSVGQSVMIS